jgi:cytochrome c oxidase assembly protein subunit 11
MTDRTDPTASADQPRPVPKRRNGLTLAIAFGIVFGMVGLSFASVPLYDLFCRVTGFGGTTQVAGDVAGPVLDRTVRVRFVADADSDLGWRFEAERREMEVRIGEPALVNFHAENVGDVPTAGTAVYNVTPPKTGLYFAKVQCFCFEEQVLMPGQRMEMPVYFYVDPAMDEDVDLDDVHVITLSYTFYRSESDDLDDAIDEYYRSVEESAGAETAMAGEPAQQ